MIAVASLSLLTLYVLPANAVHDTGDFQLDGNASAAVQPPAPNVQNNEDWDNICKAHPVTATNPRGCVFAAGYTPPAGTTAADPSQFRTDAFGAATDDIPTQGSTKDDLDLSGWKWKEAKPSPPKNDLANAFAAEYKADDGNSYLYFGGDRISNNGDANIAFWFFQNNVVQVGDGPNNSCTSSACTFGNGNGGPAVHKEGSVPHDPGNVGDLLIVSAFTNGGTQPTIQIYEWVGDGNATKPCFTQSCTLQPIPLPAGQGAACDTAGLVHGDIACALVNTPTSFNSSPWTFREADGKVANNTFKPGDFYEGGLNLTGLGLDNACFSSFLLNTRSSQSGDAILHDFTLGKFGRCGAALTTSPSAGVTEATAVSPGTSVTDTATVTGTGPTNPPDPTSPPNVNFFICGPTAVDSLATCDDPNGTAVGTSKPLQGGANTTDGIATATSDAVNTAANPLLPGRYCFRASWGGDNNYPDPITDGPYTAATANTECFIVRQIATQTVTTPTDSSGVALGSSVPLGTSLFDKAVVTGTATGGPPPGTIAFTVCDPSQVTLNASNQSVCAAGNGTALSGNPRTLVASGAATSSVLSSPAVIANKAGDWCFRATYTPTGTTYTGSSDVGSHTECVTVPPDTTTTVTTPRNAAGSPITTVGLNSDVFDYALVTGTANGGVPTGVVNFFICTPAEVTGTGAAATCAAGTGTGLAGNPRTLATKSGSTTQAEVTSSPAVTVNALGVWCFRATFVPGGTNGANYTGSSDNSHSECFTVTTTSSGASLQNWLPNDRVTLSTVGDAALDGTLVITLREGSCTGAVKYTEDGDPNTAGVQPISLSNTPSGTNFDTTNTTFKVTAANIAAGGVYYWSAVFTSSSQFVTGFTKCETSTLSINNNP